MVSIFDDEDVRDSFQRTDFKLMRTAAFSNQTLWDTLMERTIPRFDGEGTERCVRGLLGDYRRCGLIFTSWIKFTAHQTHNNGGNHGIKSPLRVAVITNQRVNCGSTFAHHPTAQNHVVYSWSRGTCNTDRSHLTWSLEEVHTANQLQPLRARIWGSANVSRACPLDAPALPNSDDQRESACPASSTAETQDMDTSASPRSTKRDSSLVAEKQQNRRQPRRTTRRTKRDGGASGSTTVVAKPKADIKVEQKSLNKIMLKAILKTHQTVRDLSSMVWDTLLIKASNSGADSMPKQTQTYVEKVRQEERGHTRGPPFVWASLVLIKSLQRSTTRSARERHKAFRRTGSDQKPFCQTKSATRFDSAGSTKRTRRTSRESH